jgi:PAS domain S-box-containing protein
MTEASLFVLVVDDEAAHVEAIQRSLEKSELNAAVQVVGTLREYRDAVASRSPDIVLMNMALPDGGALEEVASTPDSRSFPIVIMTSYGNEQTAVEAIRAGALDYVVKSPETFASIPHTLERTLRAWREIQERRLAEEALKETEERFRSLYENSTLGLYRTTPDGQIIMANPALVEMLGYNSFDELAGRDLEADGFEPSYPRAAFMERIDKEGEFRGLESAWTRRDGTTIYIRESARAIRDANGRTVYYDGTIEDITERKKAEEALAFEQTLLRALMNSIPDQVYFKDAESRFIMISRAQAARFGLSDPAEAVGRTDFDFFAEEHARQAFEDEREILRTGRPLVDLEELEEWPDKRTAWVSTTKAPLLDTKGRIIGTFGISRDITERKKAAERLEETLRRLRLSITSTIRVMGMMVEARDPYTAGHQERVTLLAEAIAVEMGLPADKIEGLRAAGQVHDVGKLSIPAEILSKPTALTQGEIKLVRTHAQRGYEILKDIEFAWPIADIVRQHHERMNGSGYPQGLKGPDIRLEARILAVSDTVEAMAADRPYRPAPGIALALDEIDKNKGVLYDPDAVAACLRLFRVNGFRFKA